MLNSEADGLKRVVVCTPRKAYFDVDDLQAHNILEIADQAISIEQHNRLKRIIESFGAEVVDIPELAGHPNSVFTRDAALCTPEGYIQLLPGIDTRRAEGAWMAAALDGIGEPMAGKIRHPGTVDGGDVVLLDRIAFIARSNRTNTEGIRQLTRYLEKMGYAIRTIDLPDHVLHLDKVLMPADPDRLLVCTDIVPTDALDGFETISITYSDRASANIICLGRGEVIVGDANHGAFDALDRSRLTVHLLAVSEFAKGAGGPNCLIMPVERSA